MKGYKGYHYKMQKLVDVTPDYTENCAKHTLACGHSFLLQMSVFDMVHIDGEKIYPTLDEFVRRSRRRIGRRAKCDECTRLLFGMQFKHDRQKESLPCQ